MKALISPNEKVKSDQQPAFRIAQVVPDHEQFNVAEPLFWADCDEHCVADQWYYHNGKVYPKPIISESIDQ